MRGARLWVAVAATAALACGGDDLEPALIEGGGITDPGIDGTVHVHVIEEDSDQPIEGAEVDVGGVVGETDADGLFSASDDALSGPQTITVMASGYTPTTWVGVAGGNATIPLSRPNQDDTPAQGTVSGTIDGFTDLPVPVGRINIALVGYTANHEDDDPANEIAQPDTEPPPNACFNGGGDPPCNWTLRTRTGRMGIYAFLGTIDAQEQIEVTGFAYESGVEVGDGDNQTGVSLTIADESDLVVPDVSLASAPEGTDTVAAAVRIDVGEDGRLVVPVSGAIEVPIPDAGLVGGSTYDLIGFAGSSDPLDEAGSIRIDRGLESVDELAVGLFLPIPRSLSTDSATFSYQPVADAALHIGAVTDPSDGSTAWAVAIFDGATEVALPTQVTLPDGELRFGLQALEIPDLDVTDFAIEGVEDEVTRLSGDAVSFTN